MKRQPFFTGTNKEVSALTTSQMRKVDLHGLSLEKGARGRRDRFEATAPPDRVVRPNRNNLMRHNEYPTCARSWVGAFAMFALNASCRQSGCSLSGAPRGVSIVGRT